ncbi:MAG TPA: DUF3108 domain-containing protein [Acetobacteraceae bacterium]
MRRILLSVLAILPCTATAAPPVTSVGLHYEAFAHGLAILTLDVTMSLDPAGYEVRMSYRTTGLAHFLYPGEQADSVSGVWDGERAAPSQFDGSGVWGGRSHRVDIVYRQEHPVIVSLIPKMTEERDPVPPELRVGTEDTLSAMAQLARHVGTDGTCNTSARIYDGRRLSQIDSRTIGMETLSASHRSLVSGTALRCDFVGQMLAGFLKEDRGAAARRPLHGSAWFASIEGSPPLPVRLQFETHWFGDVTMYLTAANIGQAAVRRTASTAP